MKNLSYLLFAAVVGSSSVASANAFNVNEHDARTTGRGGAAAATNTTPSSIVFSPGGIAVAEGTNIIVNGTLYIAEGSYEPAGGGDVVKTDSAPAAVPSLYITSRVSDMFAVGVGFHMPFGLQISWPTGHPQADAILDQKLRTYFITPSVGINLDKYAPGLSIGGGADLVPATVELEQALTFGDVVGNAHLGGDAFGIGGRAGVMYRPPSHPPLKLGIMWRSMVHLDFGGKADFDIADPFRAQLPPDGNITTEITLPQSVWGGVAYSPIPELELEANAVWIDWSTFKELRVKLPMGAETVAPQDYHDTVSGRFGAEYGFPQAKAAVRAGYIFDQTPIPNETLTARLPDVNRNIVTLGATKEWGNYAVNLGLLWVIPAHRETSDALYMPVFKGEYGIQAFVTSVSVTGKL